MHSLSKRIFISKNSFEIDPVRSQFVELELSIISHSFLSFSPVEFELQEDYDVLFFGSLRSVIFFQASESISSGNKLIACVGDKTAELLETLGHSIAFVGTQSGQPKVVAEEFKTWLGNKRVLFPLSDRSLKTIADVIPDAQKEEVVVYSTKVVGKEIDSCDVYVFTSPTNVEGFFEVNSLPENSHVIAWGKSTEAALISRAASVHYCLKNASIEELISYFRSI